MKVPEEIRAVKRPKNTIVVPFKTKKGIVYEVKNRKGCKRVNGKNYPISGVVIGYIKDMRFVAKEPKNTGASVKVHGSILLCEHLFKPIKEQLALYYPSKQVDTLTCLVILHVLYPGLSAKRLQSSYFYSFLSELYPDVSLKEKDVSMLLKSLGQTEKSFFDFVKENLEKSSGKLPENTYSQNENRAEKLDELKEGLNFSARKCRQALFENVTGNRQDLQNGWLFAGFLTVWLRVRLQNFFDEIHLSQTFSFEEILECLNKAFLIKSPEGKWSRAALIGSDQKIFKALEPFIPLNS